MWKCVYWEDMVHTYTLAHTTHNTVGNWRVCLYLCATLAKNLLDHTSNSVQDTNLAVWWPSVAGSLMVSTSLASTVQWFPLRTGLFDLSAELGECIGQGERPTGKTCNELWLIAPDSTFYLFSFWGIWSNKAYFSSLLYFAADSSEGVLKQRFWSASYILVRNTTILYMLCIKVEVMLWM